MSVPLGALIIDDAPGAGAAGAALLPASLWLRVMQHSDSAQLLRLGRTCIALHRLTQDPRAWLHVRRLPLALQTPQETRHGRHCERGNSGTSSKHAAARLLAHDGAASSVTNTATTAATPLSLRSLPFPALLLLPASVPRWSLRWSGSHVRSPTGVALLLAMPKAAIASLRIEMTSSADCSHSSGALSSAGGGGSSLASYTMPWTQLCSSDALAALEHLSLSEGCRDLHTLFPALSSVPCPLRLLPALTSLDLSALPLYGNLLRGLPALSNLKALKLQDADWGLQSARLSAGLSLSSRAPPTRMQVLSQCRSLTALHVRLPFLHGARFAACFSPHAPLSGSLRHLTIDGFDAASNGWPARAVDRRAEGEPEAAKPEGVRAVAALSDPAPHAPADFAAAFTALVALQSLCLRSVWGIESMLAAIPCAPLLRSLRVQPREAPPPCLAAIKELARAAPKLRVSVQGAEGCQHAEDLDNEEGAWN